MFLLPLSPSAWSNVTVRFRGIQISMTETAELIKTSFNPFISQIMVLISVSFCRSIPSVTYTFLSSLCNYIERFFFLKTALKRKQVISSACAALRGHVHVAHVTTGNFHSPASSLWWNSVCKSYFMPKSHNVLMSNQII